MEKKTLSRLETFALTKGREAVAAASSEIDQIIKDVADAHGKTAAQVIIRWHLQLGHMVIPKSETPSRIKENFDVFDFELSDEQMKKINGLDGGNRLGPDPDELN